MLGHAAASETAADSAGTRVTIDSHYEVELGLLGTYSASLLAFTEHLTWSPMEP